MPPHLQTSPTLAHSLEKGEGRLVASRPRTISPRMARTYARVVGLKLGPRIDFGEMLASSAFSVRRIP